MFRTNSAVGSSSWWFNFLVISVFLSCNLLLCRAYVTYFIDDECDTEIRVPSNGSRSAVILMANKMRKYHRPKYCKVKVVAGHPESKLQVSIRKLKLKGMLPASELRISGVEGGDKTFYRRVDKYGYFQSYLSRNNTVWVSYSLSDFFSLKLELDLTITTKRFGNFCMPMDFHCNNDGCVDRAFRNDHRNNCGDNSDEAFGFNFGYIGTIVGIIVGVLLCIICAGASAICFFRGSNMFSRR